VISGFAGNDLAPPSPELTSPYSQHWRYRVGPGNDAGSALSGSAQAGPEYTSFAPTKPVPPRRLQEDLFLGPVEGLGSLIAGCDESIDVLLQLLDGGGGCGIQRLGLKYGEPSLDLIEPRRPGWDEMEMDVGVLLEPALVILICVEIVEDDVQLATWEGRDKPAHEAEELLCDVFAALDPELFKSCFLA
jgi:hypothetical protein